MNFIAVNAQNIFYKITKPIAHFFHLSIRYRLPEKTVQGLIDKLHPRKSGHKLRRIGPNADGGYLVPDVLEGIKYCFSPGVDIESRFELELAEIGMQVFMADYSIEKPKIEHSNFHFLKKFLGSWDQEEFISLDTWVKESLPEGDNSDLILQMDIEGFEYECLFSISSQLLKRFRIIIIEFHGLDRLFDGAFYNQALRAFDKLLVNHTVVHNHPNNIFKPHKVKGIDLPVYSEFTFLRNDYVKDEGFVSTFPHPLDRDCTDKESYILPEMWYRKS